MTTRKTRPKTAEAHGETASKPRAAAGTAVADVDWEEKLGALMHDVSRLRRTAFDEMVRSLGVTRSQWWVLTNLSRYDGMIQSDLANLLELGKAALGSLLDRLESSEFIYRRDDPADRRVKRVYLGPKGEKLIQNIMGSSHELSEVSLHGLDPSARLELVDLMTRVKVNLRNLRSEMKTEPSQQADEESE